MNLHNQLSLLHLFLKHIRRKKPLIYYFQSHVLIFTKYLYILRKKIHGQSRCDFFFKKKVKGKKKKAKQKNNEFVDYGGFCSSRTSKKNIKKQFIVI